MTKQEKKALLAIIWDIKDNMKAARNNYISMKKHGNQEYFAGLLEGLDIAYGSIIKHVKL